MNIIVVLVVIGVLVAFYLFKRDTNDKVIMDELQNQKLSHDQIVGQIPQPYSATSPAAYNVQDDQTLRDGNSSVLEFGASLQDVVNTELDAMSEVVPDTVDHQIRRGMVPEEVYRHEGTILTQLARQNQQIEEQNERALENDVKKNAQESNILGMVWIGALILFGLWIFYLMTK